MITILIHGFYRDKGDMSYLEQQLNSLGYETFVANLPATYATLKEMVDLLALQLKPFEDKGVKMNFIAHSMGGLIAREYIQTHPQINIDKCIFIATPHHGSNLADIAHDIPLFSSIFKPVKELTTKYKYTPFANKTFKLGLIAGENNSDILGRAFMSEKSDGRVAISSVRSSDADDFIVLPFNHDDIHKQKPTLEQVVSFLEKGKFKQKEK